MSINVARTEIDDVLVIETRRIQDDRGWFSESWNYQNFSKHGISIQFKQDNHSFSEKSGTLRGLHFQAPPSAQAKLVRCAKGRLLDVAVDIRVGSPSYGKWVSTELSYENGKQLYIPEGFAHGFLTLEPGTEIAYKCSDFYDPETEGAIRFDDVTLNIDWGIEPAEAILSPKDAIAPDFSSFVSPFVFEKK